MAFSLWIAFSVALCMIHKGFSYPLPDKSEASSNPSAFKRVRSKRCSCNSWLDNECIYFCHLDIIWINTPNKITPLGLGSALARHRRSSDRCECVDAADKRCSSFCLNSMEDQDLDFAGRSNHISKTSDRLLFIFR
ncbi:hypothetical protein DNTS_015385 [Danionella cerebrum]|uniref:Endothelin-like toxin domain-containing protein n=1 Tax=Danionella cerebrum TaxID=2873325 RepID=A0A553NWF1_9TELE|nr:hypothetical protein DNTS_015385 [Danionella translucida]